MWAWYAGKACFFSGSEGDTLLQAVPVTPGETYFLKFTISGMTQGKLIIRDFEETLEFTANGTYTVLATPVTSVLSMVASVNGSDLFYGCIDNIEMYTFGVFTPYVSQCVNLLEDQGCLVLVEASCDSNNLNFAWSGLTLSMRLKAKFAKVAYKTQKEPYIDASGNEQILYFDGQRERFLQVDAAPTWTHDFLYLCMAVDTFLINNTSYIIADDEYPEIKWNKAMIEGTVELKIREKINKINKTNCG